MNVNDLYNVITQHMTPEEALRKLLEGSIVQYENLQFKDSESPVHPLFVIVMASMEMGWQMAIEQGDGDVRGMVVGTQEYMDEILEKKGKPMPKAE